MNVSAGPAPVIVALDVSSRAHALRLVEELGGLAGMFKIGNQLFMAEGPDVIREVVERGERVFLDLKFHDIPNTVRNAAAEAAKLGVSMMTIHASGGPAMIAATISDLEDRFGNERPTVVAVTVLTSIDPTALRKTGVERDTADQVLLLARMALDAGADGFVCSAEEIGLLRSNIDEPTTIVTPGVRMPGQSADDQERVATPLQAIEAGADHVVIGRYVNQAEDPRAALIEVLNSLA
jgi:orotidine-5'-phosphate decarboxylase